jgi:hypothetical protein
MVCGHPTKESGAGTVYPFACGPESGFIESIFGVFLDGTGHERSIHEIKAVTKEKAPMTKTAIGAFAECCAVSLLSYLLLLTGGEAHAG